MRGRLRWIAVLLLFAGSDTASAALFGRAPQTPHPAVCRVAVEERDGMAFGSGTLIDCREQYGLVVTNWHVVHEARGKIEVRFPDGFKSEGRPLKLDETWDLAALVIWRPPTEPAPLAMTPPQPGDRLTICGYGQGEYLQQTGRCTDYYSPEVGEPQEIVELNVQARQGDSGGPIFNDRGELAGVLFGAARGTTLGSFGGRVQTFLATLAPDIGSKQPPTQLVQSPPPLPQVVATPKPSAVDPFLAAEHATPAPVPRQTAPVAPPATPPPSLADRSSAPQLASSRHSAEAWQSAPPAPVAKLSQPTGVGFSPQANPPSSPASRAIDWYEDGRTLLALVGVAALVMTGLRSLG